MDINSLNWNLIKIKNSRTIISIWVIDESKNIVILLFEHGRLLKFPPENQRNPESGLRQ